MPRGKKKKKYTWEDLIPSLRKDKPKPSSMPLLPNTRKFSGKVVHRVEEMDGAIRRVKIYYEYPEEPEILEWVGKVRIK